MTQRHSLIAFALMLVLAAFCYAQSLGASFQLDDRDNLSGLAQVVDFDSTINFIASGDAGPTGRPLALASFALQADEWQHGTRAFLIVNIAIHLLNAVLLLWGLRALFLLRGETPESATLIAVAVTGVWVLLPLLATSSLLVVQRMTTLSATFVLLGFSLYLQLRGRIAGDAVPRLLLLALIVASCTVLAGLAKESGALLPAFILVTELTLLRAVQPATRNWRLFTATILWLPVVLIVGYLMSVVPYAEHVSARRGFTFVERLLTEAQILWLYLSKALLGMPARLGIYHGDFDIARSLLEPRVLMAVLAWLGIVTVAGALLKKAPLLAFGVFWFLAGHLIESTVVPLELYFEHRNYLPIIGPVVASVAWLLTFSGKTQSLTLRILPLVLLLNAYFLFSFASLVGDSSTASRYWAIKHPNSVRAVTGLAMYQLAEEGVDRGLDTLSGFAIRNPRHGYLRLQEINIACLTGVERSTLPDAASIKDTLGNVQHTHASAQMLSQLATSVVSGRCPHVTIGNIREFADALGENPAYRDDPGFLRARQQILANIARTQGNLVSAARHLQEAIKLGANEELVMMMTMTVAESGNTRAAARFLDAMAEVGPANPLRSRSWRYNIEDLRRYVAAVESSLQE